MTRRRSSGIDVEIDKLTNSIENAFSGEVFDTRVVHITLSERSGIRKKDWRFDWKAELAQDTRTVYGLVTIADPRILQGLLSIEDRRDHVLIHLIESAKFNQGKTKLYQGVPPNLFAFACRESFILGHQGVVSFVAKTKLVEHYRKTLKAQVLFGNTMIIPSAEARILVDRYFKEA